MLKIMKPGRKYFIINLDEPYAEEIYQVLKAGQIAKGEWPEGDITFEEWKEQTFREVDEEARNIRMRSYPPCGALQQKGKGDI